MRQCPHCSQDVPEGARTCPHCGGGLGITGPDTLDRAPTTPSIRTGGRLTYDTLDNAMTETGEAMILGGQFKILRKLGEGGMGMVYLAQDMEMHNLPVAVKILPPLLARNKRAVENLRSEAVTAIQLNHPNVVRLYGFHADQDVKFLVMEYIDGKTLEDRITESDSHKLPLDESLHIIEQIAAGLDYAHSQTPPVVHRDLKPSNIMIDKKGHVKILDFGIAREMKDSYTRVTGKSDTSGTLPYMSPEQLMGARPAPAMDVYSLGAVCYECLSGKPPFYTGDIASQIRSKDPDPIDSQPAAVNAALLAALAKDPAARPATAGDLVCQLGGSVKPAKKRKPKTTQSQQSGSWGKKIAMLVIVAGVIAVGVFGWNRFQDYRREQAAQQEQARQQAELDAQTRQQITDLKDQIAAALNSGDLPMAWAKLAELEQVGGPASASELKSRYESLTGERETNQRHDDASVARDGAVKLDRGQGFGAKLDTLEIKWREAEAARQGRAWGRALTAYDTVLSQCKALNELHTVRQNAQVARQKADTARQAAAGENAAQDAPEPWKQAETQQTAATEAFDKGDFTVAVENFTQAESAYKAAQQFALSVQGYQKARQDFEVAFSLHQTLLEQHGQTKWQEVLKQFRIGDASGNDPTAGATAYTQAKDGLAAAVAEAQEAKNAAELAAQEAKNAAELAARIRSVEQVLDKAKAEKANDNWQAVYDTLNGLTITLSELGNQGNRLAKEKADLLAEAEGHLVPTWHIVTTIDGREVPATITLGSQTFTAPQTLKLDEGKSYTAEFSYQTGNKRYRADSVNITANWKGQRQQRVALQERRLPQGLREVSNASYPSVSGLASGSEQAQARQRTAVESLGLPLEVECEKTGMRFRLIPAGEFVMGSPSTEASRDSDESPQRTVRITKPFYMGVYEVTQAQYERVMVSNPSKWKGDNLPVEQVSWDNATEFCRRLSAQEGKTYTLPTEAQWEYACRAGTTTPFYFGDTISTDQANYNGNYVYGNGRKGVYRQMTTSVGSFAPNAFGLYDMHGNVWEWCQDWYQDSYNGLSNSDPQGPLSGASRVLRGGSWLSNPYGCRAASRSWFTPDGRGSNSGFRVVCLDFQ